MTAPSSTQAASAPGARRVELLAPGGDRDAALAALHYGADALYLGLQKFSARAEAINFPPEQLGEITAFAHARTPRRRVFVTINTVVLDRELEELVAALDFLCQVGVDAVIVQDLGVARIVRRHFPGLALHASTQLAVHNLAGVETLRRLGFRRVTLARELTLEELRAISAPAGIETEVFIHGALCYSYSGLCLYSSQLRGRSGNRGRCAYPCRDFFKTVGGTAEAGGRPPAAGSGFAFSMKDLALPEHVAALRAAGVASFKIEGRKKSALYVGATVDYYRRLLDGRMTAGEQASGAADLRTIFSRPWTRLYLDSARNRDVADRDSVGHRGAPIGIVEAVIPGGRGGARLRFHTQRALERHDGLQLDLPGAGRPFGFAVDALRIIGDKNVFAAPAGSRVEVDLPRDRPAIPPGAPIYCASSQAVKRAFPFERPKPGAFRPRRPISVTLTAARQQLSARVALAGTPVEIRREFPGPFQPATDPARMVAAARTAFEKLGATPFRLAAFELKNPAEGFVPVSILNDIRRQLCTDLEAELRRQDAARVTRIQAEVSAAAPVPPPGPGGPRWLLRVDDPACLETFAPSDWEGVEEVLVAVDQGPLPELQQKLAGLAGIIGHDQIRLALPIITRRWEEQELTHRLHVLRAAGWHAWAAANVSAWSFLRRADTGAVRELDLAADWPLYTLNASAAAQLGELGARRVTLSPEDGGDNIRELLKKIGARAVVIVYQDTPLFISESCPAAHLAGRCPGPQGCRFVQLELNSDSGEQVAVWNRNCRTITINRRAFCLSHRLAELRQAQARWLRVDFAIRPYPPDETRRLWREIRAGRAIPGTHPGNFDRGLL